jgi:hypothetical protein
MQENFLFRGKKCFQLTTPRRSKTQRQTATFEVRAPVCGRSLTACAQEYAQRADRVERSRIALVSGICIFAGVLEEPQAARPMMARPVSKLDNLPRADSLK